MSATLTWQSSGLGVKTGTARDNWFDDLNTLVGSFGSDSNYRWQVASFSLAGNPRYLVLKRKDGSAGRILLLGYTSAPAAANTTLFDVAAGSVLTTVVYVAWFPSGNVDTPSNLAAASGTIIGNDSGAVKVGATNLLSTSYAALFQHFYFESQEGIWFCTQNPAAVTLCALAAGNLVVDASDVAYGCTIAFGSANMSQWGSTTSVVPYTTTALSAGASGAAIRTNHGATNRIYYHAFTPSGSWPAIAVGATDILTDAPNNKAWFVPVELLSASKGEGFVLKYRQAAWGPGVTGPFASYNTTGPIVAARSVCAATSGGVGHPWLTNFKL
jgi:hypothetical protein